MTSSLTSRLGQAPEEGIKAPVVVSTDAQTTLSGTLLIGTVQTVAGDRVLVNAQTDGTENGIYVVAAGAWTRASDWNDNSDVVAGQLVTDSSTSNVYQVSFSGTFSIGLTSVTFNLWSTGILSVVTISANIYTLIPSNLGKILVFTSANDVFITIPSGLGAGFNCELVQAGAGQIVVEGFNTTVNSAGGVLASRLQFSPISVQAYAADVFLVGGDTAVAVNVPQSEAIRVAAETLFTNTPSSIESVEPNQWYAWGMDPTEIAAADIAAVVDLDDGTNVTMEIWEKVGSVNNLVKSVTGQTAPAGLVDTWSLNGSVTAMYILVKNVDIAAQDIQIQVQG